MFLCRPATRSLKSGSTEADSEPKAIIGTRWYVGAGINGIGTAVLTLADSGKRAKARKGSIPMQMVQQSYSRCAPMSASPSSVTSGSVSSTKTQRQNMIYRTELTQCISTV